MAKSILTRKRASEDEHTKNSVTLVISDLTRGESEFFYEVLFDFMNRIPELKEEYYRNK